MFLIVRGDEWTHVPEGVQIDLELKTQDDGEFWMNYRDFRKEYYIQYISSCPRTDLAPLPGGCK